VSRLNREGAGAAGANLPTVPDAPDLGQFFTPRALIDFAFDALAAFGAEVADARVADPACGPGEWLRAALERGAAQALGADCDPAMARAWADSALAGDPRCALTVADGLAAGVLPEAACDLVVGNPPFGADLADAGPDALRELARTSRLPFPDRGDRLLVEPSQSDLRRLARYPIELLFLERFAALCRPGGWIAIILPEGVLSNARWRHVREWLLGAMTVYAVVGLPRSTFRAHGTTARTCLLLLRARAPAPDHEVALAEAESCEAPALAALLAALCAGASHVGEPPPGLLPPPLQRD